MTRARATKQDARDEFTFPVHNFGIADRLHVVEQPVSTEMEAPGRAGSRCKPEPPARSAAPALQGST